MNWLEDELDQLVASETPARPHRHTGGCGCSSCAFDEAARRRGPRAARRQTRAGTGGRVLPRFQGWTPPVSLAQIAAAQNAARRGQAIPAHIRPFLAHGPQVYRITRAGIDRGRPLSIGLTLPSSNIARRVREHRNQPSRADPPVHQAIRNLPDGQILVQAARLGRMQTRQAKLYENWLQVRERPLLYQAGTTTFEADDLDRRPS